METVTTSDVAVATSAVLAASAEALAEAEAVVASGSTGTSTCSVVALTAVQQAIIQPIAIQNKAVDDTPIR